MSERRSPAWRAWIAAGVFFVLVAAAVLLLRPRAPEPPDGPPPDPAPAPLAIPEAPPPLGRADLLEAARRATDAFAAGRPAPGENAALVGRRFVLVTPFGCDGPQPRDSEATMFWSYDREAETLRATVTPETFTDAAFARSVARGLEFEAAEGFWIGRAWTSSDACPSSVAPSSPLRRSDGAQDSEEASGGEAPETEGESPAPPRPARETLALVEYFEPGSRRAARRDGRPYTAVKRLRQGEIALGQGLRLVVEGRLAELPGGQPIGCWSESATIRPICVIRGRVDRVAVTDASRQRVLGEWTN